MSGHSRVTVIRMVRPIPVPEKTEEGDMMRHFGCLEGHGTLTPLGFKIWPNKDKRRTRLFFFFFLDEFIFRRTRLGGMFAVGSCRENYEHASPFSNSV